MHLAITGASGFLGKAMGSFLTQRGNRVLRFVRSQQALDDTTRFWNPEKNILYPDDFTGIDACIHLSGENVFAPRWTKQKKARIYDSRVKTTQLLVERILTLKSPPRIFLCASAIGIFGHQGDRVLTEKDPAGSSFLARVCQDWEAATDPLRQKGIRVVNLRFGVVLSKAGGALTKMLLPFRLGLGGVIGDGSQYMSWIALEDVLSGVDYILTHDSISGPVNMVSRWPVTNREFTRLLGKHLARPTLLPVPAFLAKAVLGREVAENLVLSSVRALPQKLLDAGYTFKHPTLDSALSALLKA